MFRDHDRVTPANAKNWLTKSLWGRQRQYRDWHGEELAEAMRRGEFTPGTQIHFAKLGADAYLIDGQHTLHAIVKCGMPITLSVLTSRVSSEQQIADLYGAGTGMPRTHADTFGAHDLANKYGMNALQLRLMGAGIRAIICKFGTNGGGTPSYETRSPAVRLRLFGQYSAAGAALFKSVAGAPAPMAGELRTVACVGMGLVTFHAKPELAAEFWSQVAFSDALDVGDARKTLANWLMANPVRKTNQAVRARAIALAWNAFMKGDKLLRIKVVEWTSPLVVTL